MIPLLSLEIIANWVHIARMLKTLPTTPTKTIVNPATGRTLEVRGFGAMRGQLQLIKGLDLTKPIYDQVSKASRRAAKNP